MWHHSYVMSLARAFPIGSHIVFDMEDVGCGLAMPMGIMSLLSLTTINIVFSVIDFVCLA